MEGPLTIVVAILLLLAAASSVAWAAVRQRRQAVSWNLLWPHRTIPFTISSEFGVWEERLIRGAIAEWEAFTCIRFRPANESDARRVEVVRSPGDCYSHVGRRRKVQRVTLSEGCMTHATVLHELGHVLGLHHEHDRPDRDQHVRVLTGNVAHKARAHFVPARWQNSLGLPYEPRSIMHYSKTAFAVQGALSIVALDPELTDLLGRGEHLTFRDAHLVNLLYRCGVCRPKITCPSGAFVARSCRCWCPSLDYTAVDCKTQRSIDPRRVVHERGRLAMDVEFGFTYFVSSQKATWFDARRKCDSMGGWLIHVDQRSVAERLFLVIKTVLRNVYHADNDTFWTSGNDIHQEGAFRWGNGKPFDFFKFRSEISEPNNGWGTNEDCVAVRPQPFLKELVFYDNDCGHQMRYLCGLPHRGCFDRTPTCAYYRATGQCKRFQRLCKRSCGGCQKRKKPSARTTTSDSSLTCLALSCSSSLSAEVLAGVAVGEDVCVRCPSCSCNRSISGFGIYPAATRVCCAVAQMTNGISRGIHVITLRKERIWFPSGRRHGISSNWAGFSFLTFTVKGYEPNFGDVNVCHKLSCSSTLVKIPVFQKLSIGGRLCVKCPRCYCRFRRRLVIGSDTYNQRSSVCCAAEHTFGDSGKGLFYIRKVMGREEYGISYRNRILSQIGYGRDAWAFRVNQGPRSFRGPS